MPVLELLESRLVPTVNVNFANGILSIDGSSSSSATLLQVSSSPSNNTETFVLTGDQFSIISGTSSLIQGTSSNTFSLNTVSNPLNQLNITQRANAEALSLGLNYLTGTGNVTISAPGDAVTLNNINISGDLSSSSGDATVIGPVSAGGAVTIIGTGFTQGTSGNNTGVLVNGSITAGGNLTITGSAVGTGPNNSGVFINSPDVQTLNAGGSLSIIGTGSNGSRNDSGVWDTANLSANGTISISGKGQGTGNGNFGTYLQGNINAGSNVTITGSGTGSATGSNLWGVSITGNVTSGGSITITGTTTGNPARTGNFGISIANGVPAGLNAAGPIILNGITVNTGILASNVNSLTIAGQGFDPVAANNTITFDNGVTGTINSVSSDGKKMNVTITGGLSSLASGTVLHASITNSSTVTPSLVPVATVAAISNRTSSISYSISGYARNLQTGLQTSTITIRNIGNSAFVGPFFVALQGLTSGVTLQTASITIGNVKSALTIATIGSGDPEITIPSAVLNSLAQGASFTLSLAFSNPSNKLIKYTPNFYTS